jgi:3-hydroxyisobutyrate dehydrogenase-like beta-hydroxyacid dehydrogenase
MGTPLGFVGLGQMGLPIVRRLLGAGHGVLACDRRPEPRAALEAAGGQWAGSPREVADRCETVLVSLPTPQVVRAVALEAGGLAQGRAIRTYVDLSTTGPIVAREVAQGLGARGIVAIDAPVSGGVAGAEQGTLAIMVSGPQERCQALWPVLGAFGQHLFQVGQQPGQGHLMKLLNNLLSTTALAATLEALTVGAKAGLEPSRMLEILKVSSGTNHAIESKIPRYLLRGVPMGFSLELSLKDVTLAVEAGRALGLPMRMGGVTAEQWQQASDARGLRQDYLQVVRLFEDLAGVRWAPDEAPDPPRAAA